MIIATIIGAIAFLPSIALNIALALGAPLGAYAMNARYKVIPPEVRKAFIVPTTMQFVALFVLLSAGHVLPELIPFMVTPIVSLLMAYGAIQLGLMPAPTGIIGISSMPIVAYGIMQGSWQIGVYQIVATLVSAAIWFPFFKAADSQALKDELDAAADETPESEKATEQIANGNVAGALATEA